MLKRTLHFGNPAHLSVENSQLKIELKDENRTVHYVPIEDIGMAILEHPQITLTSAVMQHFSQEKVALIACNDHYMPSGMFLPFDGNYEQTEHLRQQISISVPLKKQLWQQTVRQKIHNQRRLLASLQKNDARLRYLEENVLSGDTSNCEGQAAAYYWRELYGDEFVRSQDRTTPNSQLNYGYALLRSIVARAITSSGLHPSFGLFHRNKYNAFCLADDLMEPYRQYVDRLVIELVGNRLSDMELTHEQKVSLLLIPQIDVTIEGKKRPLFHAVRTTTASLNKCFSGEIRKISYPEFE